MKCETAQYNSLSTFSFISDRLYCFHHDTFDTEVELNSSDMAETSMMREDPRQSPARVKVAEAAIKR